MYVHMHTYCVCVHVCVHKCVFCVFQVFLAYARPVGPGATKSCAHLVPHRTGTAGTTGTDAVCVASMRGLGIQIQVPTLHSKCFYPLSQPLFTLEMSLHFVISHKQWV